MKNKIYPIAAVLIISASAFTFIKSQSWKISGDYSINFSGDNASGIFRGFKGSVNFDEADLASSRFDVAVDVDSINTGNGMKNTHAKSEKWFDAEKYPDITFVSTSITKTTGGYEAKGNLQIHGVTKDFTIPFSFNKTASGGAFVSTFVVNRLDFNMKTPEPDLGAATILKVDLNIPVHR
jgi:polyisoprenoid-binding protein YceI